MLFHYPVSYTHLVTHDFATALQLGGNMLVMKEGRIIESGEVQFVFDHTTEPYTCLLYTSCSFFVRKRTEAEARTGSNTQSPNFQFMIRRAALITKK